MQKKSSFSTKDKVILVILVIFLLGFCYYQYLHKPVTARIEAAEAKKESLTAEIASVNSEIAMYQRMQDEIDDIIASGQDSYMASYNNSKAELKLLNDILSEATQYSISFANVTRNGDQIRRDFSLRFIAPDYETMQSIIEKLTGIEYRCMVGNMNCYMSRLRLRDADVEYGAMTVDATATFYETMVGGNEDVGIA